MKRFLTLILAMAAIVISGCNNVPQSAVKGQKMPEFTMISLDGKPQLNHDLFADKVVVFNAMASWCAPCGQEMPDLVRLSEILPKEKFLVVALSVDTDRDQLDAFLKKYAVKFPVFIDDAGDKIATPILHSRAFPETFILNREGVLLEMVPGAFPWAAPASVAILKAIYETGKIPSADAPPAGSGL